MRTVPLRASIEIFHASWRATPGVVKLRASSGIGFPCASYSDHSADRVSR
jgi:hypothetical protein